jgi:hypothetical protein
MTRQDEQYSCNSSQVCEAERRLTGQHIFIDRLRASGNDTRSAEKALEVMRDISARSLSRAQFVAAQGGEPQARPSCAATRQKRGEFGSTR